MVNNSEEQRVSCFVTWHAVYLTSTRREGWSCLLCVYPQLFNQGTLACQQRGKGSLDYSASAKWGKTGLILFELQHLSQLNGPISSLKQEKGKRRQEGGVVGRWWWQEAPTLQGTKPGWRWINPPVSSPAGFNIPRFMYSMLYDLYCDLKLGFMLIQKLCIQTATCLPETHWRRQKSNLHSLIIQRKCQQSVTNWLWQLDCFKVPQTGKSGISSIRYWRYPLAIKRPTTTPNVLDSTASTVWNKGLKGPINTLKQL